MYLITNFVNIDQKERNFKQLERMHITHKETKLRTTYLTSPQKWCKQEGQGRTFFKGRQNKKSILCSVAMSFKIESDIKTSSHKPKLMRMLSANCTVRNVPGGSLGQRKNDTRWRP
jgi:hypothetical protein